ncbi:MAG: hypothetical protein ACO1OB_13220 [Archangium sp.]
MSTRLEGRFAAEQRKLNRGVRAGTLTEGEAGKLQSKLDGLHKKFSADAFEGGTGAGGAGFAKELKGFGEQRKKLAGNNDVDLNQRSANIDKRIENGLKNGSLTEEEASALKQKAEALKSELGNANPAAMKELAGKFKELSKEVRSERHDNELDPAKRKENFQKRIDKGIADGSLTEQEAASLKDKLAKLGDDPSAINSLSREIWQSRHNGEVDTAKMGASLQNTLSGMENQPGTQGGQFADLQAQLQKLMQTDAMEAGVRMNTMRERLAAFA